MQTIMITGGTGLAGRALTNALIEKGYGVVILTRNIPKKQAQNNTRYALWNIPSQSIDVKEVQNADYIIHLAGAGVVEKKWTAAYKKEIIDSRIKSSELLVNTLKCHSNSVKAVISMSAIGWYGADHLPGTGTDGFTENDPPESNFLGETCRLWEESIDPVTTLGKRLIKLRTGIVLSNEGGALAEFKKPLRFGIAPILGNGKQVISWIHIGDLCRLIIYAIENENISGVYNAVAPGPVSNRSLMLALARSVRGIFFIPIYVPGFILRIMLGQRSIEVLKSARVSCKKIKDAGFVFLFPSLDAALKNLLSKKSARSSGPFYGNSL